MCHMPESSGFQGRRTRPHLGTAPAIQPGVDNGAKESMSRLLRGLAAGYGAKKMGGGCFSTVLIFIVLWWLLGHFGLFR